MSETRLPTIPDFNDANLASVATSLRAVKLAIEILGGMRQSDSTGAPMLYVQTAQPDPQRNQVLRRGDLWIKEGATANSLRYWDGNKWAAVSI